MNLNEDFREDFDGQMPEEATAGQAILGIVIGVAASAFLWAMLYMAWQAIKRQDAADLLILAAIFVALPAWIVITRDSHRRRDGEMYASRAWLREQERKEGFGPHPSAKARKAYR